MNEGEAEDKVHSYHSLSSSLTKVLWKDNLGEKKKLKERKEQVQRTEDRGQSKGGGKFKTRITS